jgi:hypothetical protein
LAANGKLQEWGANIVDTLAFAGDAVLSFAATLRLTQSFFAEALAIKNTLSIRGGRLLAQEIHKQAVAERFEIMKTTTTLRDAVKARRAAVNDKVSLDPNIEQGLLDAGKNSQFLRRIEEEEQEKLKSREKGAIESAKIAKKSHDSRLAFHRKEMQDIAALTMELIKANEIEKTASEVLQDKLDSYVDMSPALREYNQLLVDGVKAQEASERLMKTTQINNQAIREEAQEAERSFQEKVSLDKKLLDENVQLNIDLIKNDKERAIAQLAVSHDKNIEEIDMLKATQQEKNRLINQEIENQEIRISKILKADSVMDEFSNSAARNAQTAFADFLFNPFDKGLNGMVAGFADAMRRMVAEALAAQLARKLFGEIGGNGGGFLGTLFSAFGSSAGSNSFIPLPDFVPSTSFASGTSHVPRDMIAQIHKGEKIIPAGQNSGGGNNVSVNVNVDASSSSASGDDERSSELGNIIGNVVQQQLLKEMMPGGVLA